MDNEINGPKFGKLLLPMVLLNTLLVPVAMAWDGYNTDTGTYIEVESYDHQGRGEGNVEYYDSNSGEYRSGYLDMHPGGTGELTDDETGETFEVEME